MKTRALRVMVATVLSGCIASSVGCSPAYPPANSNYAYNQDSKGYEVPYELAPQAPQPGYVGVDPGLVIAGVAAAGLLGYAIGNNNSHHHHGGYYGRRYYRPAPYGNYAPRYYR